MNQALTTQSDSVSRVAVTPSRTPRPFKALRFQVNQHYRAGSSEHALIPSLLGGIRKLPNGETID